MYKFFCKILCFIQVDDGDVKDVWGALKAQFWWKCVSDDCNFDSHQINFSFFQITFMKCSTTPSNHINL